ncbi:Crp/Fnr family transcriptional regulator [Glycomyces sp. NPDC047010]|uniref:Crp/Fnr family transcriptional regulator n=1 Tax=Glycomyces sp. NPDC047010 TaxID=3155023 RepID=UPI0033E359C5
MQEYTRRADLLTEEELRALAPRSQAVAYPTGTTVVCEGDDSDFVLYLRSGHLKVVAGQPRTIVRIYKPGEVAAEFAVLLGQLRTADLVTLNRVEALLVPGAVWVEFLYEFPQAACAMMRFFARMVVEKDHRQVESMTSSEHKIARGILDLIEVDLAVPTEDGLRISGFTQSELGLLCGLSRESASAVLRQLREHKVLSTGRGSMTIHDVEALHRITERNAQPPLVD